MGGPGLGMPLWIPLRMFGRHHFSVISSQYLSRHILLPEGLKGVTRELWVVSRPCRCDKNSLAFSVHRWWRGCWVRQDGELCEMGQLVSITGVDSGSGWSWQRQMTAGLKDREGVSLSAGSQTLAVYIYLELHLGPRDLTSVTSYRLIVIESL